MENKDILSTENFEKIKDWLEGKESKEPGNAVSFITTLYVMYMDRAGSLPVRRNRTLKGNKFLTLKNIMNQNPVQSDEGIEQKITPAEEDTVRYAKYSEMNTKTDNDINVACLGKAVKHCARLYNLHLSLSHIQIMLYELYGYRLAKGKDDIFNEKPRMWRYGPVFVTSYSSLKKENIPEEYECWKKVKRQGKDLETEIHSLVTGLGEKRVKGLTAKHTAKNTPWDECRKRNPDKWGSELDANKVKEWFRKNLDAEYDR